MRKSGRSNTSETNHVSNMAMHRNSTLFLLLLWGLPLTAAETVSPIEYRKVQLATMDLHFEDITDVAFDKDGYAFFRFEVSVSPEGVVTGVNQIEGAAGPTADNLKSQVMKYTYIPEIRHFKPTASKTIELIWLGAKPDMPPYSGTIYGCKVKPTKRHGAEIIYPISLNLKRIGGSAVIRFEVSPEGNVENAESIEYSNELFARHARIGMQAWDYDPVTENGKYIRCYAYTSVTYEPW
jgi:TonB family protein